MSKKEPVDTNVVGAQVVELIERHKKLKVEHDKLKQELSEKSIELKDAQLEITKLKADYCRLKLAKAYGWDEKSKREANDRISKLVRDINKCLGLLKEID